MTQAHVFATQVGLQPPKKLSGPTDQTNFNSLTHTPDALWQLGQAQIDVVQNTNSVYTQFPNNFGLYKSQLQTLQGRTDGSISAESGNPNFSKTSAGVKMQQDRTNSQDNYLRNKADTASAKMAEKMMNVHMAQMEGADILDAAEEDIEKLLKAGYLDDNPNTPEPSPGDLPIMYEELKATFKFEYDARPEADEDEKNRMLELIDIATSNPNIIPAMQQSGYEFNLGEAFMKVINASGTTNADKILTKLNPEDQQAMGVDPATGQPIGQPQGQPQGTDPQVEQKMQQSDEKHQLDMQIKSQKLQPQGQPAPEAMPQGEDELQVTMEEYGVDENVAGAIMQARAQGFDEAEIMAYLNGGQK